MSNIFANFNQGARAPAPAGPPAGFAPATAPAPALPPAAPSGFPTGFGVPAPTVGFGDGANRPAVPAPTGAFTAGAFGAPAPAPTGFGGGGFGGANNEQALADLLFSRIDQQKFATVKVTQNADYMGNGRYLLKIMRTKVGDRRQGKGMFIVVELLVLANLDPSAGTHRPGDTITDFMDATKDWFDRDLKGFVGGVAGRDPTTVLLDECHRCISKKLYEGLLIKVNNKPGTTENNRHYTKKGYEGTVTVQDALQLMEPQHHDLLNQGPPIPALLSSPPPAAPAAPALPPGIEAHFPPGTPPEAMLPHVPQYLAWVAQQQH